MQYLREAVHPDFALSQLVIFLTVCTRPGISQVEICEELGMLNGTVSRNTKQLSKYIELDPNTGEKRTLGYDLVTATQDLEDRRRMGIYPTTKGEIVVESLMKLLYPGEE